MKKLIRPLLYTLASFLLVIIILFSVYAQRDIPVEKLKLKYAQSPSKFLPLMGMQSFDKKNTVSVKKVDVSIAKNYLNEDELKLLGLLVEQYLAFAETMALQQTPMYMKDWITRLDSILQLNGRELLTHAGKISHEKALQKSEAEFEKFKIGQRISEKEQSLKEIEEDIKKLMHPKK